MFDEPLTPFLWVGVNAWSFIHSRSTEGTGG